MTPNNLVSIIIPCYNSEDFIHESIQSCINQTYRNCEVIVINDGSTDSSLKKITQFESQVKIIDQPNRGGCAARNKGLECARGKYIQFLDADDVLEPECVEKKITSLRSDAEIVCSRLKTLEGYDPERMTYFWVLKSYNHETMLMHGTPQTAAPLHYKDDLMNIGGFKAGLPFAQEYDLHLRLAFGLKKKFSVIDHEGVYIRPRANSLSRAPRINKNNDVIPNILSDIITKYRHTFSEDENMAFSIKSAIIGRAYFKNKEQKSGEHWLSISSELHPHGIKKAYRNYFVHMFAKALGYYHFEHFHGKLRFNKESL
jgi:glycosyltransferase involved in cell wall biosynthesis